MLLEKVNSSTHSSIVDAKPIQGATDFLNDDLSLQTLNAWSTPGRGFYSFPHSCAR